MVYFSTTNPGVVVVVVVVVVAVVVGVGVISLLVSEQRVVLVNVSVPSVWLAMYHSLCSRSLTKTINTSLQSS